MSLRGCILDKFIKLNDQLFDSVSCQSFFSLFTLLLEKAIISKKLIVSEFWRSMKFRSQFIRSLTTLNSFSYNFSKRMFQSPSGSGSKFPGAHRLLSKIFRNLQFPMEIVQYYNSNNSPHKTVTPKKFYFCG